MTERPKISVIMLTYNRESLVSRAIESILSQTFLNFEFILVDNGSTDRSGAICDEFAQKDDRVRVLHRKCGNIGSGRNAGVDLAHGEYITFIDDDDYAEPSMLKFLYGLIQKYGADIAVCGSTKEADGQLLPNYVYDECLVMDTAQGVIELLKRKRYSIGAPCKLWRRSLIRNFKFPESGKYEDIFTVYKFFAKSKLTVAQGIPKYVIRRHSKNNSAFTSSDVLLTPEQLDEYFMAYRERTAWLCTKLPSIAGYVRYSEWSYYISMCNKICSSHLVNCSKQLSYVRSELLNHFEEFSGSPYLEPFEREYLSLYFDGGKISGENRNLHAGVQCGKNAKSHDWKRIEPDF